MPPAASVDVGGWPPECSSGVHKAPGVSSPSASGHLSALPVSLSTASSFPLVCGVCIAAGGHSRLIPFNLRKVSIVWDATLTHLDILLIVIPDPLGGMHLLCEVK